MTDDKDDMVISGERNLLSVSDLSSNMTSLRKLFDMFEQKTSLLQLLESLKKKYNIPTENFIAHADIAPTRKNDPNIFFPWKELAQRGFGYWYDDTTNVILPPAFDELKALRIIGYDIRDTAAALKAFNRHWLQDTTIISNDASKKILYQVEKKFE